MAKSDSFNDIEELLDCDDELTQQFNQAASHLQTIVSELDNNTLVLLYGYYKQANEGRCNIPKPGWFDSKGRYKWEAWHKLGDMPQNQAKSLYIENIKKLDANFTFTSTTTKKDKKDSWVTVSTLSREVIPESSKSLTDYIKDDDITTTNKILKAYSKEQLADALQQLDEDGLALIHWAADRGSLDILQLLLSLGADVNLTDSEGQTPLHYAATCGHDNCIKLLLDYGANSKAVDVNGDTPADVCGDTATKALFS
ncbi:acyl-CoA-binding domain-containing protein 6 [Onthophagus taurus]|uniref:acyl-CoA-binding domain-containing protein 6 n=1 Tax=Onthophagus taurus TaxID=166361 RepID=UPI000C2069DB|nr:acyl-CoA-binding domain-containing protein 6 [Onthophagus taurus]